MTRQRVVLSIEQDLLDEAHAVAVRRHTSVNEMVRQFLKQVVRQERQRLEAWRDVQRLLDKPPAVPGLIVGGTADLVDADLFRATPGLLPAPSRALIVERAGHWPHRENAELVSGEILGFVGAL